MIYCMVCAFKIYLMGGDCGLVGIEKPTVLVFSIVCIPEGIDAIL